MAERVSEVVNGLQKGNSGVNDLITVKHSLVFKFSLTLSISLSVSHVCCTTDPWTMECGPAEYPLRLLLLVIMLIVPNGPIPT